MGKLKRTLKSRNIPQSWVGRVSAGTMSVCQKVTSRLGAVSIQTNDILHRMAMNNFNIYVVPQKPQTSKATLS